MKLPRSLRVSVEVVCQLLSFVSRQHFAGTRESSPSERVSCSLHFAARFYRHEFVIDERADYIEQGLSFFATTPSFRGRSRVGRAKHLYVYRLQLK